MITIGDIKLVPAKLPPKPGSYDEVIVAFLGSGEETVRVEGPKSAESTYSGLKKAIKPEHPCRVINRGGACYLTRSARS